MSRQRVNRRTQQRDRQREPDAQIIKHTILTLTKYINAKLNTKSLVFRVCESCDELEAAIVSGTVPTLGLRGSGLLDRWGDFYTPILAVKLTCIAFFSPISQSIILIRCS